MPSSATWPRFVDGGGVVDDGGIGGGWWWLVMGGCAYVMHGRSRMAIDSSILAYVAGTEHAGSSFTDQTDMVGTEREAP